MRKAQVTIFIIIGILLVGAIALFFLLEGDVISDITGGSEEINPNSHMVSCIEDKLIEVIELISAQGGYTDNSLYIGFDDKNISYLCYNINEYQRCVVQEPMLIQHLKEEIHDYLADDVERCFGNLNSSLEKQGYDIDAVYRDFEVVLTPKKVELDIDASITATKTDEIKEINNLKVSTLTKFYDLALVVQEILSQEAVYCDFENMGYMLLHPDIRITKKLIRDETVIYTVEHRESKEEFVFAVRSCALKI